MTPRFSAEDEERFGLPVEPECPELDTERARDFEAEIRSIEARLRERFGPELELQPICPSVGRVSFLVDVGGEPFGQLSLTPLTMQWELMAFGGEWGDLEEWISSVGMTR